LLHKTENESEVKDHTLTKETEGEQQEKKPHQKISMQVGILDCIPETVRSSTLSPPMDAGVMRDIDKEDTPLCTNIDLTKTKGTGSDRDGEKVSISPTLSSKRGSWDDKEKNPMIQEPDATAEDAIEGTGVDIGVVLDLDQTPKDDKASSQEHSPVLDGNDDFSLRDAMSVLDDKRFNTFIQDVMNEIHNDVKLNVTNNIRQEIERDLCIPMQQVKKDWSIFHTSFYKDFRTRRNKMALWTGMFCLVCLTAAGMSYGYATYERSQMSDIKRHYQNGLMFEALWPHLSKTEQIKINALVEKGL
jgi:hypothetical protein